MDTRVLRCLGLLGLALSAATLAADESPDKVIRSAQGFVRERAPDELRDPFTLEESRTPPARVTVKSRGADTNRVQSAAYGDAFVYEAFTELFYDTDQDGYFHYLRVQFDVDTVFESMLVYAELYLSADGQAWEHFFTTDDFRVWGSDPEDDYEVETDLVSGYSTGQYDLLIEIYDAEFGDLVDEFGPLESPEEMSLLPLEDSSRDGVPPADSDDGGGGAVSWLLLAALAAAVGARKVRFSGRPPPAR